MARKMKKWSEMLTEKDERRSKVYREGAKFVYDSGDLPDGLMGVGVGCVLCLQRTHGISATQMPGTAEDWVVVGGGSGGGGGAALVIDPTLSSTSSNPVQNKVVKAALDGKMDANQAFKTVNGLSLKGSGNITLPGCQCEVPFTTALRNKLNALPTITLNGNTIIINGTAFTLTPAGQGGDEPSEPDSFPTGVYLGTVSPAVTGFSSKSEALIASITAAHVKSAVAGGEMDKVENLPVTENNRASVTGGAKYGYLLALVPQSQNYVVKVYNGLTGYDPFGGDTGYYANGELTLTIDGTVYRLYGVYLAAAIQQNDPYFITISDN